jgi:arabinofuranan 3-O-arabinosyltransferase
MITAPEHETTDSERRGSPDVTPTSWIALAALPIIIGVFLQRVGEITYLTRVDRVLDPITNAARGFDLWNPYWDMGAVQYQQNGYWLPFDLWFGVVKILQIPVWIGERTFSAALIAIALFGFVRLADAFRIGTPATRIAAGAAFAISPVILSRVAWQSPFAMGIVFLPWVLLPLVRASAKGSTRKAAAISALAVALMGGANAAVVLTVLPAPVLFLLTRSRGPRRASLIRWWFLLVPMATLWWIVILYFFARYSPNTLAYTETSRTTAGPTSLFEVIRGTADWVSRLPGPQNPAGFSLSLKTIPIFATAVVAATGIAGLARRRLPERTFFVTSFLLGIAAVGGGFGGLIGNPANEQYRALLDGALSAFRNVYKFQALISLPLAMGIAHVLAGLIDFKSTGDQKFVKRSLAALAIAALVLASWPLWRNSLTRGPGATQIPTAWIQANNWLSENSPGRTLVLPGIPDADFDWGFTAQIPIQWGSDVTWATRSQAPLSGENIIEYLDAIEIAIERGGDADLSDYLRRGGFTSVVVPNDQRSEPNGAPPPETVRNAMTASGFTLTAAFGDRGYGYGDLQQVDIYSVPGGAVAATYAASSTTWLSGDIASTLSVPRSVFGDRPYLLSRDRIPSPLIPSQWIITDGNQASTIDYGLNRNNKSYIHDFAGDVVPAGQDPTSRTYQELDGFASVTASSVGPGMFFANIPSFDPANILDGDANTWWVPRRVEVDGFDAWGPVDPAVEARFTTPTMVDHLDVALFIGPYATLSPVDVTVHTDAGDATTTLLPIQVKQPLNVVPGITSAVKVSIARSSYLAIDDAIGIRELTLPGTPVTPRLVVPHQLNDQFSTPGSPDPAWVFTRNRAATSPIVSLNSESQISRKFSVPKIGQFRLLASASSTKGQPLLRWLGSTPNFSVTADSTWGENPKAGPRNLVDGDTTTHWRSGNDITDDGGSSLIDMRWSEPRSISSLVLVRGSDEAMPQNIAIYAGAEARSAPVTADGTVTFEPITTSSLTLRINYAPVPLNDSTSSRVMGLGSIDVPALSDLYPGPIDRSVPYVAACDAGPKVAIGSATLSYSIATTAGALIDGTPFDLVPCGTENVALNAGVTLLDTSSGSSLVTVNQLVLGNSPTMAAPTGLPRTLNINHWGTNDRTVTVASGTEGLLVVNEAFNEGWEATLNGTKLTPLTIDGWRQAFIVPEGDGGTVDLRFAPDRIFKLGTAFGLFTLLAVFVMALWPDRKKRQLAALNEGQPAKALLVAGVAIGAVWCTGIGAVLLLPAWWLRNHRRSWLAPIAFLSMSAAGVLVVLGKRIVDYPSNLWGAASYPVSALAATAFLCALVTLLPRRDDVTEESPETPSADTAAETA